MGEAKFLTNFGDELTPLVLEYATGRRAVWTPANQAGIIAVGSIVEYFAKRSNNHAVVWGAGLREAPSEALRSRIMTNLGNFAAVRGPHTAAALGLPAETALGDPGTLVSELGNFNNRPRRGTTFLPHFRTWGSDQGRRELELARSMGIRIAPPSMKPRDMIEAISRSDFVLSSSLHGIVLAHTLGIPVQSVGLPGGALTEPVFKYEDYYSSVGLTFDRLDVAACLNRESLRILLGQKEADVPTALGATRNLAQGLVKAASNL